ncbi:MAG: YciE/YciF ferroxidase family protein [Conexibacter sp.]
MATRTLEEQLIVSLRDAHALEQMALAQLERAPSIAGEDALKLALRDHLYETRVHERLVRDRLDAHGAKPSGLRDLAAEAGGAGFILFARVQPDTPGKLATHAFSYEHLELAAYELLARLAELAGDHETAVVAHRIRGEEAAMAARLEATFERTVAASLENGVRDDPGARLTTYLDDAHALEQQAVTLLERAIEIGGDPRLVEAYRDHLGETHDHLAAVEELLDRRDGGPSRLKDAALRMGARNLGAFFRAQADTPGKLAAFAYAFEHLEIGGYEQLRHVALAAGDLQAAEAAARIVGDEQGAADTLLALFDVAVEASLEAVGAAH